MTPILAIVGRPNVGKSTLFNRIVGGRRAITLDVAGVTRDRHYGQASWEGRDFLCVDTGGLLLDGKETLEKKVRGQVDLAIREAAAILFVMNGREGLLPEEREIARLLRRSGKKVFFVVNKIDDLGHEERLAEFFTLGEEICPVSSEHGLRVNDLLDKVVADLPPMEPFEKKRGLRIALIGRPNVGKSSLLNRLLGEERVIVDEAPGTTRDAIDTILRIDSREYRILDTAGIQRKGIWRSKVERYSILTALKGVARSDLCLLLLDAAEGIHNQDAHVAGYAAEAKKEILLLWNKWDLVPNRREAGKRLALEVRQRLKFLAHAPLLFVSARTGEGCASIWPAVDEIHKTGGRRVKTAEVNEVFERIVSSHNPPVYKGRPVKFFYATQTRIHPPTFVVFVSEPTGVHFSFKRYLVNQFRETFGFAGTPIEILFRKKR